MTTHGHASCLCLFGGALFAAGVAAGDAHAQGFAHGDGFGVITAERRAGVDPYFRFEPGSPLGFGSYTYANSDLLGVAISSTDEIGIVHNRAGTGTFSYSAVFGWAYVFAVSDVPATISWDFAAWESAYLFVENLTDPGLVFDAGELPAGTASIHLMEGAQYRVRMAIGGGAGGGDAYARAAVFEPCVADLDRNGILNFDDIDAFVAGFLGGCP